MTDELIKKLENWDEQIKQQKKWCKESPRLTNYLELKKMSEKIFEYYSDESAKHLDKSESNRKYRRYYKAKQNIAEANYYICISNKRPGPPYVDTIWREIMDIRQIRHL